MAPTGSATSPGSDQADDIGFQLIVVAACFLVLVLILVGLRIVAQITTRRKPGMDDYFLLIGILCLIALDGITMALPGEADAGRHLDYVLATDPNKDKLERLLVLLLPIQVLYITSFTCTKISILGLYLRIFVSKTSRRFVYGLMIYTALAWIALVPVVFLACLPFSASWNLQGPGTTCINQQRFYQFCSFPNIVSDVVMLFLPIPILRRIQITRTQKIGLAFSFFLGSIGLIAALVRFAEFSVNDPLTDSTWTVMPLAIWSIIEPSMYAAAACLPTLRPLVHEIRERMGHSRFSSGAHLKYAQTRKTKTNLPSVQNDRRRKQDLDEEELELVTEPDNRRAGQVDGTYLQGRPQAAWIPRDTRDVRDGRGHELPIQIN